jgi:hypothetical protein
MCGIVKQITQKPLHYLQGRYRREIRCKLHQFMGGYWKISRKHKILITILPLKTDDNIIKRFINHCHRLKIFSCLNICLGVCNFVPLIGATIDKTLNNDINTFG